MGNGFVGGYRSPSCRWCTNAAWRTGRRDGRFLVARFGDDGSMVVIDDEQIRGLERVALILPLGGTRTLLAKRCRWQKHGARDEDGAREQDEPRIESLALAEEDRVGRIVLVTRAARQLGQLALRTRTKRFDVPLP